MTAHPAPAPLRGILVADFSRILAGPLVAQALGELGAAVIKVERPGNGDDTRSWGPPFWGETTTYFTAVNRGKRSVALDLEAEADLELARRLAARADVLVENFRPGVMERHGLDYGSVTAGNPRIVYCSISGFGREGTAARLPGVDLLVQAAAGWMHVTGSPDGPPTKVGMALADVVAGLYATSGVLAALHERGSTGRGRHVQVSLFESALAALVNLAAGYLLAGADHRRDGNRHPSIAPYEPVWASDRQFVLAAVNDGLFAAACRVIGRDDLAADPRFATNPDRRRNVEDLIRELEDALRTRPAASWIADLRAAGVPAGEINSISEAFRMAADLGLEVVAGPAPGVRSPIRMDGSALPDPAPAPSLDADGDELRHLLETGGPLLPG